MPSFNRVVLVGRAGRDADYKPLDGEKAIARFSLATDRPAAPGTDAEPEWHQIVCWDRRAESVSRFVTKGRLLLVSGRLTYRSWETPDGKTAHTAEIVASEVVPLDRRPESLGAEAQEPDDDVAF
ncbi:MAG TPA: single-stranded DNA-binding protein [Chloroflexota bacterium]|nr:single-stranded DNA-binding protein [Chloroflexota bacterium]